jgi:N6-L-threonylcarbamoyladenine synthase
MLILGIETSCDETGVALYDTDQGLVGDALYSQIALHAAYGGVVPELASRDHVRRIGMLLAQALQESGRPLTDIDVVAYTAGPGLPGALLVGASTAQGLAFALDKPVLPIHHLEGHLLSPLLSTEPPRFPFTALLVSGGHTQLMAVENVGEYQLLGETIDDAAGEAFDKSATLLGLAYPGGPALAKWAAEGDAKRFKFPRPMLKTGDFDFSFSGLKTAVLMQVRALERDGAFDDTARRDVAASFQAAVVDVLTHKSVAAARQVGHAQIVVAGGVGANLALRSTLSQTAAAQGISVFYPPQKYCTDNGAMIAHAAALRLAAGAAPTPAAGFSIRSRWPLVA